MPIQLTVVSCCQFFACPGVPPFSSIQVFTCFSLKPPRRGELVTAGATSGPALSDPLTGNVGGQVSHLPSFDLNHLIRPFNK